MASSLLYNLAQLCVIVGILSSSSAFAPSSRNSRSTGQRVRMVDRATTTTTTTTTTTRLQGTVTPDENQGREALSRRRVLSSAVLLGGFGGFLQSAKAEESEDLTSQLYNPDGSLKSQDIPEEAKSRTITIKLGPGSVATDGVVVNNKKADSSGGDGAINEGLLEISYEVPTKWSQDYMYLNPTKGVTVQACDHIYAYSVPYDASVLPLSKASTAGVAKTLQLGTVLSSPSYNKNDKEEEEGPWDAADVMGGK
eukprot:scaffold118374_cov42-Attheya_sp.AAC.1